MAVKRKTALTTDAVTGSNGAHAGTKLTLSREEARGVMLAAQGLLHAPAREATLKDVRALIDRLGAVQIDTISVVERSQYLVLWSRLGAYDATLLDAVLFPHRDTFEYWGHAASILPMSDYRYYRPKMLRYLEHIYTGDADWMQQNPEVVAQTLQVIRERGPMASADFERPADGRRATAWDWHGPKDSRRALAVLWTTGDLMVHSRRAGGQKVYDVRERVLREAFGKKVPGDDELPTPEERLRHFARRTVSALGVVTPSWLWDYFRLSLPDGAAKNKRAAGIALLDEMAHAGLVVPATVDGLGEPAYIASERLADLERLRKGDAPDRTTLLSPFDSLIWHRPRSEALFDYEVCFEAYVVPEKRRYGYYCLAILHRGRLVGRLDAKAQRAEGTLAVRALYLEPGVVPSDALLDGLADALRDLARFLKLTSFHVERSEPVEVAPMLAERLQGVL
ncbi:MAG: winged helix-turn-helix domain-containing protein [Ktedonobacterales bacterium]